MRKELELNDETYTNEIRVLRTLQELKHPNILKLLACYTHKSKHNIISTYVPKGNLQTYLEEDQPGNTSLPEMLHRIAGLVSSIWALHDIVRADVDAVQKGQHQDLRPANILYDGTRFILSDFGLSNVKAAADTSGTSFKGRTGFYQAPESAELIRPYREHKTTRASDIFALGCIIADLIVHFVRGSSGIKEFRERRKFQVADFVHNLYHKGSAPNEAVFQYLAQIITQYKDTRLDNIVKLIEDMLQIKPASRPVAFKVAARVNAITVAAFADKINNQFSEVTKIADAIVEHARFMSWATHADAAYFLSLPGPQNNKIFDEIVELLRKMSLALQAIKDNKHEGAYRAFFFVRHTNHNLLSLLPESTKELVRDRVKTIILKEFSSDLDDSGLRALQSAFSTGEIDSMMNAKRLVNNINKSIEPAKTSGWAFDRDNSKYRIKHSEPDGTHRIVQALDHGTKQMATFFEESITYDDIACRERLRPRLHALCDLLSKQQPLGKLKTLHVYGMYDDQHSYSYNLLYRFPDGAISTGNDPMPQSLEKVLRSGTPSTMPALEIRIRLAHCLAESLAAFHDFNWYHKNLTSRSILFFPTTDSDRERYTMPYLVGFQHSRPGSQDRSEGPVVDKSHRRYHNPNYMGKAFWQYEKFRPEYDYYSLGILLLELGTWKTIDILMDGYASLDDASFAQAIIGNQIQPLRSLTSTKYASIVERCLSQWNGINGTRQPEDSQNVQFKLNFRSSVVAPLKAMSSFLNEEVVEDFAIPKKRPSLSVQDRTVSDKKSRYR